MARSSASSSARPARVGGPPARAPVGPGGTSGWTPMGAWTRRRSRAMRDDTALVSLMAANGEIGTLEPVRAVGRIARDRGVPFHVDGVGTVGRVPLAVDDAQIDLLTLSSNDIYGPPGAGALWVRADVKLAPVIVGGGQGGGYRSGTENLPAIVGLGVAAELVPP